MEGVDHWGTLGQPQKVGKETWNIHIGTLFRALGGCVHVCVYCVGEHEK